LHLGCMQNRNVSTFVVVSEGPISWPNPVSSRQSRATHRRELSDGALWSSGFVSVGRRLDGQRLEGRLDHPAVCYPRPSAAVREDSLPHLGRVILEGWAPGVERGISEVRDCDPIAPAWEHNRVQVALPNPTSDRRTADHEVAGDAVQPDEIVRAYGSARQSNS